MMNDAYVFIGSNIGRDKNYLEALKRLRALGKLVAASPVYDTLALGETDAPRFYNGAVWLKTDLAPHALRHALREIEHAMGRTRTADKNAPRVIDLDLVLYDEVTLDDEELRLPDPHIFERPFMARALAQVNPDYVIPPDGPTLVELAYRLRGNAADMPKVTQISEQAQALIHTPLQERTFMPEQAAFTSNYAENEWPRTIAATDATAHQAIADAVRTILLNVGEDPTREGLLKTPNRVARAYDELLSGYRLDPVALVNGALFDTDYRDMVVVKDIEFFSLCEHHILPFFGKAHVAYLPNGQVLGLSKIPRIVNMYARRLQLQEKMTQEIADCINALLNPRGVAVIVTGQHMCSMMRGVNKSEAKMMTQVMYGEFQNKEMREMLEERLRAEN